MDIAITGAAQWIKRSAESPASMHKTQRTTATGRASPPPSDSMRPGNFRVNSIHLKAHPMISNKDFVDLLSLFNAHDVRYLIIGGYAFSYYAEPRATKDLDLFVSPDLQNAQNVYRALASFGTPLSGITPEDFTNSEQGFQIGQPPNRIDILTAIEGVSFEE